MTKRDFNQWWIPVVEVAASSANPLVGVGLKATRQVATTSRSRKSRDNAGAVYVALLCIGIGWWLDTHFPPPSE